MSTTEPAAAAAPETDDAPHVLVVDDDQRLRDLLRRYLSENGFRVTAAGDAAEARAPGWRRSTSTCWCSTS
jgi:two-component system phosphate regulon response regulator OmpR